MPDFGKLKVHPAADEFPLMDDERRAELAASIKTAKRLIRPVVLTADGTTIIDGRNRYLACQDAGIKPRFERFSKGATELEIVQFIQAENLARRDLNPGQRVMIYLAISGRIEKLMAAAKEQQRQSGGDRKSAKAKSVGPTSAQLKRRAPKASDRAAKDAKTAGSTVRQGMKVKGGSPQLAADVAAGKVSLNDAYKQVRQSEAARPENEGKLALSKHHVILVTHKGQQVPYQLPKSKPKFNQTNDQVSWAKWTWNPVTGCLHLCDYCYSREMAETRESYKQSYPVGFTPLFHHERLDAPKNTPVPEEAKTDSRYRRVFTVSMGDLFGQWVPDEWIEKVLASASANPQWDYLFLTKFPRRYVGLHLPETAWIGTSVDEQKRVRLAEDAFRQIKDVRVKWLSLEPLLAPLEFTDLSMFDWVVIGSQSQTEQPDGKGGTKLVPAVQPEFEWVARITAQARECGCKVYHKPNLLGIPNPQCAGMKMLQEEPFLVNGQDRAPAQGELGLRP